MTEDKCCELIDGKPWQGKTVTWKDRPFVKKHYLALFYMPIGIDGVLKKLMEDLDKKKLISEDVPMMLWRNEGMFGGDIYIALNKDDPAYETEKLSGKFFTMFFEGKGYQEAGNWHKMFQAETKKRKIDVKEVMTFYALCPGCMKKFGKMQAVLFGRF
jgi:hypothetical protein